MRRRLPSLATTSCPRALDFLAPAKLTLGWGVRRGQRGMKFQGQCPWLSSRWNGLHVRSGPGSGEWLSPPDLCLVPDSQEERPAVTPKPRTRVG